MNINESCSQLQYNTAIKQNFAKQYECSCSMEHLLRIKDVIQITGLSRSYVYELTSKGLFPQSVALVPGGSSKAWVASEIKEWVQDRINASRTIH